jgi:putative hydroxymethylpyrimidine transport system substrate-binding protein
MLIVIFAAACSEDSSSNQDNEELKEIDVMLDWYPNAVHSFLYVAEEKGYFKDEGLDVSIQFPSNTTDPLNLAASGKVTLGFYYQPDVVMARANEDIPVKSVGAVVRSPLNYLVFKEDQQIKTPADLIGKKVGYPGIPINQALLTTIMKDVGENPDDVELIDVGFELGSAIITENVDAVFGAFINHEVPVLEHEGYDIDYINPVDFGVPNYYELVVVTGDQTWEKQQDEIEAFWRAAQKGFDFMEENPDEALTILLDNQDEANFPLDEAIEKESMEVLLPKMKSADGFRYQEEKSWQETAEWLKDAGLIENIPEMDHLFAD